MTVVMLLVCQTRRGDFGYIGGHMQWSYVYVQLSDCGDGGGVGDHRFHVADFCSQSVLSINYPKTVRPDGRKLRCKVE